MIAIGVLIWSWVIGLNPAYRVLLASPVKAFLNIPTFLTYSYFGEATGWDALSITLMATALATAFGASLGLLLGVILGVRKYLHDTLDPYIVALFTVPKIVLLPVLWIAFGFGLTYEVVFGTLGGFFPMLITTIFGVKSIHPAMFTTAKSMGASTRQVYSKIILPSSFESIMGGLRLCFQHAFVGIVISEMFVGNIGLGYLAFAYSSIGTDFAITNLYSLIIVTAVVGMIINIGITQAERRVLRYKRPVGV